MCSSDLWESFRQFRAVCLDTTHLGTTGSDLLEVAARLGVRIAHVHLSDYDGRNEHLLPGRGILPLEPFVQWLGRRKFSGTIVVELSPHGLASHDEARLASEFAKARVYVEAAYTAGATVGIKIRFVLRCHAKLLQGVQHLDLMVRVHGASCFQLYPKF